MKSFTIYIENEQLYSKDIADRLEKKILSLDCSCILKVSKYDSNPKITLNHLKNILTNSLENNF